MSQMERGNSEWALEAWKRALLWDGNRWEAMNNLSWVLLEEGRTAEARMWIDRAMAHEEARATAGVRDTEAAVRRAEEEHARFRRDEKMSNE